MKRLFWLAVGVAAGAVIARKATGVVRQLTPAGVAGNLGEAMRELASAVGAFGAEVRAGMAERESELHRVVEDRTGIATGEPSWRLSGDQGQPLSAQRSTGSRTRSARARRSRG